VTQSFLAIWPTIAASTAWAQFRHHRNMTGHGMRWFATGSDAPDTFGQRGDFSSAHLPARLFSKAVPARSLLSAEKIADERPGVDQLVRSMPVAMPMPCMIDHVFAWPRCRSRPLA
jgi:hypothetical protein